MNIRIKLRSYLPALFSSFPQFRGKGRIILLLDKLLTDYGNPKSYIVRGQLNDNVSFIFDLRPWGQKFAYYYREWETTYINILSQIYNGDIFLDVGSSLGLYVVCLAETIRKFNGHIISVEPVPFNLERQQRNVALNRIEDIVTYIPFAMGAERGIVKIRTDPDKADNNAIISNDGSLEIIVMSLDSLVCEENWGRIGMIKVDIEGYEPMFFKGAKMTILKDKPIIFAEFNRERMNINTFTINDTWDFLINDLGYRCYSCREGSEKLFPLLSPGNIENLLFIPRHTKLPKSVLIA